MMNRKRSFLSSHEWKTIPWRGLEKSPKDTLFDILVEIPELLEGLDTLYLLNDAEIRSNLRHSFLEKLKGFEEALQSWYEHTSLTTPWICINSLLSHNGVGLAAVHLMAVYWTARLVLFNTRRLPIFPRNEATDCANAEKLQAQIMPLIARLTEEQSGWFGRHAAVFPGGAVHCLIKGNSNKIEKDLEMEKLLMLFQGMQSTTISPTFLECKR
jgi:hypothetical protein